MAHKKMLIIMFDADNLPLHKGEDAVPKESSLFLMECAKPPSALLNAGYELTFVSPKGQTPKPDLNRETFLAFAGNFYEQERE
jgi:hypothetical protein